MKAGERASLQPHALPVPAQQGPSPGLLSEPEIGVFLLGAAHVSVGYEAGGNNKNQTFSQR